MKSEDKKNISNVKVSKDCFKELKKLSIDKDTTLQEVVSSILERFTVKKNNKSTDINESA